MKNFKKTEPLYQKITGFRWLALAGAIVLVILYLAIIWWVQPLLFSLLPYWLTLLVYGVLGGATLWIALDWLEFVLINRCLFPSVLLWHVE